MTSPSLDNFHFIKNNISASPVYGVYIKQLVRYCRACSQHSERKPKGPSEMDNPKILAT